MTSIQKISKPLNTFEAANQIYNSVKSFYHKHYMYTVTISETDPTYSIIHFWLTKTIDENKQRKLEVSTKTNSSNEENSSKIAVYFNDNYSQRLTLDGETVFARVDKPEVDSKQEMTSLTPNKIEFFSHTKLGQKAIINKITELYSKRTSRKAIIHIANNWGGWNERADLPNRKLESVILSDNKKEEFVEDLQEFLDSESLYNKFGIPWHRGYLFHGKPGTGKSSIVRALANHFNMDLWYIPLNDLKSEASLINMLSEIRPRSILLLEDIDVINITQDRNSDKSSSEKFGFSLSGLLNALDGIATPHGLVTFMTTNYFERLDAALIRAGRMDRIEKFDYPNDSTVAEIFEYFYETSMADWPCEGKVMPFSQAELIEMFKRSIHDAKEAEMNLHSLLIGKDF